LSEVTSAFITLKSSFPAYEERAHQIKMAEEVFSCLRDKKRLLVEAGTGVGKSFAYLVPAILSKEKTVVSTATIALQDQLANKDLTFLQGVMPQRFSFAILKGKNNYLCLKREREFQPELDNKYERFIEWVSETETGDKDELHFIPEFWSRVCGDSDDCSSSQCPYYNECFYYAHFKSLYQKDIIVVNHHLLVYDIMSDFNLLPHHSRLIMDEAHQLENVISHTAGNTLNYTRVMWLLYRLKGLKIVVDNLFEPVESFFKRRDLPQRTVHPIPADIIESLINLRDMFALDKVVKRLTSGGDANMSEEMKDRVETTINYIMALGAVIDDFIQQRNEDKVYYMTSSRKGLELNSSLVECRDFFERLVDNFESVVMTSATLAAGGKFSFLKSRLGIAGLRSEAGSGFKEVLIGSPFDFRKQAVLYINRDLPAPNKNNTASFQEESMAVIEKLIEASKGRALVLFTSYSHLRYVSENIETAYRYKAQGDMPPAKLIKWFKKTSNSVLLATATFWQGIDIRGDDLSLVIIVKMPFGSPGDPVYDERCQRLGERWFSDLALPSAILTLRQGFGRLIRGLDEYGVIAMLDTRLIKSSYGKTVVSSLPDMNIVHEIDQVKRFLDASRDSVKKAEGALDSESKLNPVSSST
jgi:ATP-dependent DNA helicase DinG